MAPDSLNPIFRRIREKVPYRRSVSLTDEDIERLSYLEKAFTTIYTDEVPFSFSKTVSKAIDLANLMVLDPKLLLEEEQYYEKFSEELKEQLKYEIESGTLYKLNVLFRLNVLSYELYSRLATQETLTDEDWRHLRDFQEKDGLSGFKDVIDYSLKIRLLKNLS